MTSSTKHLDVGRAMNALQDYLIRKLHIPKVYIDAEWNGLPVQVLAIDRAGVGDVHAAWMALIYPGAPMRIVSPLLNSELTNLMEKIKSAPDHANNEIPDADELPSLLEKIKSLPLHYRYVAIVGNDPEVRNFNPSDELTRKSFAEDGVGRVGLLFVDLSEDDPSVRVILKAERFRSSKEIVELADQLVAEHTPNWEVRE